MSKVLFFFTSEYPFGTGETFIENEMPFLAQAFDKIVIVSNNCDGKQTRQVPDNVIVKRFPYELNKTKRLQSVTGIFNPIFWREISCIKKIYKKKLSSIILKTALISLQKSKVFKSHFSKIISENSSSEDTVVAYSYWANDMAFALSQMKSDFPKIKMITRAHGWDVYFEANDAQYLPYRKPILEGLTYVSFIAQKGFDYYKNIFPELMGKMRISRLGVFSNQATVLEQNTDVFTIVSCSNVIALKRIHLIAEALLLIKDVKIEWHHFGDGTLLNAIKSKYEKLFSENVKISVQFHGRISNQSVIDFYRGKHPDIIINVSSTEGVPVSIMEAFSCGIPAIATDVGGTSEIVNSSNGFLLSSNTNSLEIAKTVSTLLYLSNSQKREMKENAFNIWKKQYNAEINYCNFIKTLL
jgi:glycosyltransferase involved in cell wall biosynthesis